MFPPGLERALNSPLNCPTLLVKKTITLKETRNYKQPTVILWSRKVKKIDKMLDQLTEQMIIVDPSGKTVIQLLRINLSTLA